jgi:hypothetical protein
MDVMGSAVELHHSQKFLAARSTPKISWHRNSGPSWTCSEQRRRYLEETTPPQKSERSASRPAAHERTCKREQPALSSSGRPTTD